MSSFQDMSGGADFCLPFLATRSRIRSERGSHSSVENLEMGPSGSGQISLETVVVRPLAATRSMECLIHCSICSRSVSSVSFFLLFFGHQAAMAPPISTRQPLRIALTPNSGKLLNVFFLMHQRYGYEPMSFRNPIRW